MSNNPSIKKAKFKVGDIICKTVYPGSDTWHQVCEVLAVAPREYVLRPIQSKTSQHDWSMTSTISGASYLSRGGWEEEQTTLFRGRTLEQEKKDKENAMRNMVRKIVKEELAAMGYSVNPINSSFEGPFKTPHERKFDVEAYEDGDFDFADDDIHTHVDM